MLNCGSDKNGNGEDDSSKIEHTNHFVTAPNGNRTFQLGKVKGYRIQVYTTLSREEALKYKAIFQKSFPDTPNYLVYEEPVYKVRIGDYLSKGEAKDFAVFVNKVKDLYGSFVVKCMVNAIIPKNKDSIMSITNTDSIEQVIWVDSTGKGLGLPEEEILTKEGAAAERKMQEEDKLEEKVAPKEEKIEKKVAPKEEKVEKKVELPKVEKITKPKPTSPKDSVKRKNPFSTVR